MGDSGENDRRYVSGGMSRELGGFCEEWIAV